MKARVSIVLIITIFFISSWVYAKDISIHNVVGIGSRFTSTERTIAFANTSQMNLQSDNKGITKKDDNPSKKSTVKAAVLSALIPGAGQYYLGSRGRARVYFTVETISWLGFAAFKIYGHWKKDDFILFARTNANAELKDKSDEFLDWVGFYSDIDEFNRNGRNLDPSRPYLFDTPENHWRWQNEQDQATYRSLKNRSREAYRRANFMVGIAIANRIVSVIDAIRSAKHHQGQVGNEFSQVPPIKLHIDPFNERRQVWVAISTPF
jgi:hypothetical protein